MLMICDGNNHTSLSTEEGNSIIEYLPFLSHIRWNVLNNFVIYLSAEERGDSKTSRRLSRIEEEYEPALEGEDGSQMNLKNISNLSKEKMAQ